MRDYALAEGEEKRRCENVVAFWVKESEKYTRLVKKLNAGDNPLRAADISRRVDCLFPL